MTQMNCSCGAVVEPGMKSCSQCGRDMRGAAAQPAMHDLIWARGDDDFAINVPEEKMKLSPDGAIVVRHGSKALFFEDGRLVEVAESGRYTTKEGGFVNRLLNRQKNVSAMLVDAGDVVLSFKFPELRTQDNLFADLGLDVVLRLNDPNVFFVNTMKERRVYKIHELRGLLFGEIRNALEEGVGKVAFNDLNANIQTKNELASRMEGHLRQTFNRTGLDFGQVRALSVAQRNLDATARAAAEAEMKAREVEARTTGKQRVGEAEIADGHAETALINKRLEVLRKLKQADVAQIKTEEEFRKLRMEIDRDRVLDETEWAEFQDEILWKDADRKRDRTFLENKINIQQNYDLKRLELVNQAGLSLEQKKKILESMGIEREIARGAAQRDLEAEKARFGFAIEQEEAKEDIRDRKGKTGLQNLRDLKAIKREDETARKLAEHQLDRERKEMYKGMTLEEMIAAVPDTERAKLMVDLAHSKALKGLTPDEIVAMKDPAAFAKALEERARNSQSEEIKQTYERMVRMGQDSADRTERMAAETLRAMSGQMQSQLAAERQMTERTERMGTQAMGSMANVAAAKAGAAGGMGQHIVKVCSACMYEMGAEKKSCPNCGAQA